MSAIRGQTEIVIEAPVHEVYVYLLDFTRHPEWVANLSKVTQESPGPVTVGSRFQASEGPPPVKTGVKLRMMAYFLGGVLSGAKTFSRAEITALESDRTIAWRAGVPKGDGYFNLAQWEMLLEDEGGATHLTQRFVYQPQSANAQRMVDAAGPAGLQAACQVNLARLKQRIEGERVKAA